MGKKYFVYILYSSSQNLYYKGSTSDIESRLRDHNENHSRYTANRGPWEVVYLKQMVNKKEALIEEKRLKRLNRRSIKKLIDDLNSKIRFSFILLGEINLIIPR